MSNLVTTTPTPFASSHPFTTGYTFGGGGQFREWTTSGPYEANGKLWCMTLNPVPTDGVNAAQFLAVFSSIDAGVTWVQEDVGGEPQLSSNGVPTGISGDVTFGHDNKFYVFIRTSLAGTHLKIHSFNTSTGLWESSITGPLCTTADGLVNNVQVYQNSTDTNLVLMYSRTLVTNEILYWTRVNSGVFGAENVLRASAVTNLIGLAVIDSVDVVRAFFYDVTGMVYQIINTDDSLGVAVNTGLSTVVIKGKPVIWQGVIAFPGYENITGNNQPQAVIASPSSNPSSFVTTTVFTEPLTPTNLNGGGDTGLRVLIDGSNALWIAWVALSHVPGTNADPVTVSHISMMQLCSPVSQWGNYTIFWDQLTDPQLDQPLNDADAIEFSNFSINYVPSLDVFSGIANISGFNSTYAYYLKSTVVVSGITICSPIVRSGMRARLQIYDDGAGMYIFDAPLNSLIGAGSMDTGTGLAGGAIGPFILPSPLPITKPGLLTVQISNVNAPLNTGNSVPNTIESFVALVFAVPKKCKGQLPQGGSEGFTNMKGILG